MTDRTNDVTVTVTFTGEIAHRLRALTAGWEDRSVEAVLMALADHAQQAVYRPGAWERGWICQAFGDTWTEYLLPDPDPERAQIGWQVPGD